MNELLSNPTVQAALVAVVVVALKALATWINSKVSYTAQVNEYWCYIQPVAEAVRDEVLKGLKESQLTTSVLGDIVQRGVVQFIEAYKANEWREPTKHQIDAVTFELEDVADRAMGRGK